MKPRIKRIPLPPELLRGGVRWVCLSPNAVGFGLTPAQAWHRWVRNQIDDLQRQRLA